jgi:hypothetical protein
MMMICQSLILGIMGWMFLSQMFMLHSFLSLCLRQSIPISHPISQVLSVATLVVYMSFLVLSFLWSAYPQGLPDLILAKTLFPLETYLHNYLMLPVWKHLFQRKGYKKGDKSKIPGFFSGSLGEVWVLRSMMTFQLHMVLYQLPIMWQEIMIFLNGKHLCNFPSMKGTSGVTHRIWDPLHIHGIPCKMCEEQSNSPLNYGNGNRNLLTSINP